MSQYSVINSRAPRLDAPAKATGRAVYADDLTFPNQLYGAILQSPLAHARILNIDTSRAKALPGVKAVVTSKDVDIIPYGVSPARYDETILAVNKVRYVGDEVAAVAAIDLETALEAVSLIKVDYEELPAVFDPVAAMAEGAPLVHEHFPRNICAEVHQEFGDVEAAFAQCDFIHVHKFVNKRQDAAFLEPNACTAVFDAQGQLTLYSSTQVPHYVQRTVAMVLKLPIGKVRVVKPYVGGGFGPKAAASALELLSCLLSMKTLKPVKMGFTREQVFLHSRGRHQFFHTFKTGVKKDGTLLALHNECFLEGGAYSSFGIATVYYAGSLLGGPYKLPNMKYDGFRLYTNKPACGAQRGHGGVAARAGFEQQLDLIAKELGLDPLEMRLKNIMETGDITCNELDMSSLGMKECIEAIRDNSDWKLKKGKLPKGKGIGMACGFFVSGAGYPIYRSDTYHATVVIKLSEDGGTALVQTGSAEIGQGSDTAFAMIAAEALGVRLEDVRIVSGDTDYSVDLGAYSSRQTLMTGHATKQAAEDAKRQVLEVLAETLNVPVDEIMVRNGLIAFKRQTPDFEALRIGYIKEHRGWGDPPQETQLTFKEAARLAYLKKGTIVGTGKYKPPKLGGSFKGAAVGTSPAYGCSAMMAEVTVDLETGEVTMDKITDAHDCGLAINRTQVEGQMEGSVSMGLGESLFEEVKFNEKGQILNASLGEYKIPTALDVPAIQSLIIESGEPNGPYGAKEVGDGFGAKIFLYPEYVMVTALSKMIGRPVKWMESRSENYVATTHGRDHITEFEIGATRDGKIVALKAHTYANLGGVLSTIAPGIPTTLYARMLSGVYKIPSIYAAVQGVYTNTGMVDAYRGAGRPEATYLVERAIDLVAAELGMDSAEIRRKNFIQPAEFPYTPANNILNGLAYDSGNYEVALDRALEIVDYKDFRKKQAAARKKGRYLGLGFSTYVEMCGVAPSAWIGAMGEGWGAGLWESANVRVHLTGKVVVTTGSQSHGQGHETTMAQVTADALGIPLEDVMIQHSDTLGTPFGYGTYGSRSGSVGTVAVHNSLERIKDKARLLGAHMLEAAPEDVVYDNGRVMVKGAPDSAKTIQEIAAAAALGYDLPEGMEPFLDNTAYYDPPNCTYPFGTHICIVEVDAGTGEVKVLRYVAVDDVGKVINPMIVDGQVHGGIAQGVGQALWEGAVYDDYGNLTSGSLLDYALPRADNFPPIELDRTETLTPVNPLGVKGAGETGTIASTPAVVNAVMDALAPTGVRHIDMPLTAEKVWRALNSNGNGQGG